MQKECRIETVEICDDGSISVSSKSFKSNDGVVGNLCDVIVNAIKDFNEERCGEHMTDQEYKKLHKLHSELMEKYSFVNLDGDITKIEANTFNDMEKLEGIAIPKSVTEISPHAFNNCWPEVVCVEKDSAAERFFLNKEYIIKNLEGDKHDADLPDVKIFYDRKEYDDFVRMREGLSDEYKKISYSTILDWTLIITAVFPLFPIIKFGRIFAHNEIIHVKKMTNKYKNQKLGYSFMFDLKLFCFIPVPPFAIILLVYRGREIYIHDKKFDELSTRKKVLSQILNEQKNKEQETNKNDQQIR